MSLQSCSNSHWHVACPGGMWPWCRGPSSAEAITEEDWQSTTSHQLSAEGHGVIVQSGRKDLMMALLSWQTDLSLCCLSLLISHEGASSYSILGATGETYRRTIRKTNYCPHCCDWLQGYKWYSFSYHHHHPHCPYQLLKIPFILG